MKWPMHFRLLGVLLSALLASVAWGADSAGPLTVKVSPTVVTMGTFYGGAKVRVEGTTVAGSSLVVAVRGADVTEVFNKVGRVGPIWVNTGKVSISGVPSVCLLYSSCPVGNCLCRSELDRCELDAAALKKRIKVKPQHQSEEIVAEDFLKLKVRQGKYQMGGGGVQIGEGDPAGSVPYSLEFVWPKTAAPGNYAVRVFACRGNMVQESLEVPLRVQEVGFPALIVFLARDRASLYGIICIVVAMLAGFGIDFIVSRIFKKRVASH
jgi:Putative transmembrane protein (Alph_Pro_TM)